MKEKMISQNRKVIVETTTEKQIRYLSAVCPTWFYSHINVTWFSFTSRIERPDSSKGCGETNKFSSSAIFIGL